MADELVEIEDRQTMSREEAAARLREVADQLARHNQLELERGGLRYSVKVPDQVDLKIEVEIEDGASEIEIEITW